VLLPKTQTSIRFNADSTATESLVPGRTYRWKVYVSKDDAKEPLGWKLISVSEDQRGLIKILHDGKSGSVKNLPRRARNYLRFAPRGRWNTELRSFSGAGALGT